MGDRVSIMASRLREYSAAAPGPGTFTLIVTIPNSATRGTISAIPWRLHQQRDTMAGGMTLSFVSLLCHLHCKGSLTSME